jgi:hypothetical protein
VTRPIDLATGTITTDDGDRIGPGLRRAAFEASSAAADADVLTSNEPWMSWSLTRHISGRPFRLGLYFHGDRLEMAVLALDEPAFGASWADWSLASELARKAAHEAWLAALDPTLGDGRAFPWGALDSSYDQKSGGSQITLRYQA